MTSMEIRERLNKAIANVEKAENTVAKRVAMIEKKTAQLKKMGFSSVEEADEYVRAEDKKLVYVNGCARRTDECIKILDLTWSISSAIRDNEDSERKIKELQQKVENWQVRLENQLALQKKFLKEVPEAFKTAMQNLVDEWTKWDIEARETMRKNRAEMERREFRKMYSYYTELSLDKTDDQFRKANERDAMMWVLDLYNRTYNITGEVTDCSELYFNGKALNGVVIGKSGRANVETIIAGGWNIQRLHYRVLVHKI